MKRLCTITVYSIACLIALPAYSYVGPASNSMGAELIIGGIVAATLIIAFTIAKYFYRRIRGVDRPVEGESEHKIDEVSPGD